MEWFTRDWAGGHLTESQVELARTGYADHVDRLRTSAPELAALLDLDLHDGRVLEWSAAAGTLAWRLVVGDLQVGYEFATIRYVGADVVAGADSVEALRRSGGDTEVQYDEVDVQLDGRCVHRILLWPEGELHIRFRAVEVSRAPATPADYDGA